MLHILQATCRCSLSDSLNPKWCNLHKLFSTIFVNQTLLPCLFYFSVPFSECFANQTRHNSFALKLCDRLWEFVFFICTALCQCINKYRSIFPSLIKHIFQTYAGDASVHGVGVVDGDWRGHCSGEGLPLAEGEKPHCEMTCTCLALSYINSFIHSFV